MTLIYAIKRDIGTLHFKVETECLMDDKICNILDRILSEVSKECEVFKEDMYELLLYKRLELKFGSS